MDPEQVARLMLSWHALDLISCTRLQTLWAGYGSVCAVQARATTDIAAKQLSELCGLEPGIAGSTYPLVLKLISPPANKNNSDLNDEGHLRKMLSYEVEQTFYNDIVPLLGDDIPVAKCLASTRDMKGQKGAVELEGLLATLMVDLSLEFPVSGGKRGALTPRQVHAALDWLARFHRRSWAWLPDNLTGYVLPPTDEQRKRAKEHGCQKKTTHRGIWLNGGYTYLATRRREYASLADDSDSEWSDLLCQSYCGSSMSAAEMTALFLTPSGRAIESYIHGDVKSENLFTTVAGDRVAFYDFQYVGLGLGVCDLAKLLTCSVQMTELVDSNEPLPDQLDMGVGEKRLLEQYYRTLTHDQSSDFYEWDSFIRHWETALVDWCRFQASWGFWGNTDWLEARVRSILNDADWSNWLISTIHGEPLQT
ncbi:Aminoglycoside phosphotransferase domain-containing protein [Penicillium ucsense]|uniref:Aminoglycoside phosphotransferase domain-containing protein n=1 Tax=Penicillium ucsense TaxID=2839758 RepID=A0A8J8WIJ2_9EURO|nr:Aminoglycoside phosphotransferase domain-containing protein [Penicillium ucsense]KAF7734763.1 Aminoglycoside phosphotransferase domain-containing protein [Penicillium ucsense]